MGLVMGLFLNDAESSLVAEESRQPQDRFGHECDDRQRAIIATRNGITSRTMAPRGSPEMFAMMNSRPVRRCHSPIMMLTTTTTPKCTRSIPKA